jgi:predicted phosphate transport protein (TIGR00153 family)
MRKMTVPPTMQASLLALTRRVLDTCVQAERVINELDELLETGFGEREVARVEEMLGEVNRLESDTDELEETTLRQLFAIEDELGVGTLFWYKLIHWIGDMADHAEKVGNRLRLLIAQ